MANKCIIYNVYIFYEQNNINRLSLIIKNTTLNHVLY